MLYLPRYHLICRLRDRFMAQVTSAARAGLSSCQLPVTRPTLFGCPRTGLGISLTKRNKASSAHRFYVINIVASLLGPVKVLRIKSIDALLEEGHHFHGQAGLFRIFRKSLRSIQPAVANSPWSTFSVSSPSRSQKKPKSSVSVKHQGWLL